MSKALLPSDPLFEERVRASFSQQAMMSTLGASIQALSAGEVHITMPFDARFTQQDGFLHAGTVTTLVDSACGYAAYTLMPAGSRVLSVEFKINLLSPARGGHFRAEGRVIKPGRTITVCEGKLFAVSEGHETLCALMQATMICIHEKRQ